MDKLIVTNKSALQGKYGAGYQRVESAINRLIAGDANRGITSRMIEIDQQTDMATAGAPPVANPLDQAANKKAIDAVYRTYTPAYLLILGSVDVIPHQDLTNPLYQPDVDDDQVVPSDLPYACDTPYSNDPVQFSGPTRVVGRLPDLTGDRNPAYIERLLQVASQPAEFPKSSYLAYFGLTADVWKRSTSLNTTTTFGNSNSLRISPPDGPNWSKAELAPLSHFINCHGSPADPAFYGQHGNSYPVSHLATQLPGKVSPGTAVAAECCYGAQLYAPTLAGGQAGICSTYLANGAYAFWGSSTIAYGPESTNDAADLMCQYFFVSLLGGSSTGRAALEARQRFIQNQAQLDPTALKTVAQYLLLGDPSIQPVQLPAGHGLLGNVSIQNVSPSDARRAGRKSRRETLARRGQMLGLGTPRAVRGDASPTKNTMDIVAASLNNERIEDFVKFGTYTVVYPDAMKALAFDFQPKPRKRVHVWGRRNPAAEGVKFADITLVVAIEEDDKLIGMNKLYSR